MEKIILVWTKTPEGNYTDQNNWYELRRSSGYYQVWENASGKALKKRVSLIAAKEFAQAEVDKESFADPRDGSEDHDENPQTEPNAPYGWTSTDLPEPRVIGFDPGSPEGDFSVRQILGLDRSLTQEDENLIADVTSKCSCGSGLEAVDMDGKPMCDKCIEAATDAAYDKACTCLPEIEAAKDLAVRTPDSELDPSEFENQPEEVARNQIKEAIEEEDPADTDLYIPSIKEDGLRVVGVYVPPMPSAEKRTKLKGGIGDGPAIEAPAILPKTKTEKQVTLNELFWKHGTNAPSWPDWAERLETVGLVASEIDDVMINKATLEFQARVKRQTASIGAKRHVLGNLPIGTCFQLPDSPPRTKGKLLDANEGECKVLTYVKGSSIPKTAYWSRATEVVKIEESELIFARETDNNSNVSEQSNSDMRCDMRVPVESARKLLSAMGLGVDESTSPKRLQVKLAKLDKLADEAKPLEDEADKLVLARVLKALKAGKEVIVSDEEPEAPKAESNGKPTKEKREKKEKAPGKKVEKDDFGCRVGTQANAINATMIGCRGTKTTEVIASESGQPTNRVKYHMIWLAKRDLVVKTDKGEWKVKK